MFTASMITIQEDAPIIFEHNVEDFHLPEYCTIDGEKPNLYVGIEKDVVYEIFGHEYSIEGKTLLGYRNPRDGFVPVNYSKLPENTWPSAKKADNVIISEISESGNGDDYTSDNMFLKTRNSVPFVVYAEVTKKVRIVRDDGKYETEIQINPLLDFLGYDLMHTNKNGVTTFSKFDVCRFSEILKIISKSFVYPGMFPKATLKSTGKPDKINLEDICLGIMYKIGMEQMLSFEVDEYILRKEVSEAKVAKFFGYWIPDDEIDEAYGN